MPGAEDKRALISNLAKSIDLDGLANTSSITDFVIGRWSDSDLFSPSCFRNCTSIPTSQKVEYLGRGGLSLKAPLSILYSYQWMLAY